MSLFFIAGAPARSEELSTLNLDQIRGWQHLGGARPDRAGGLIANFALQGGTKVCLAVINPDKVTSAPALSQPGCTNTTSQIAAREKAWLAVNGGYFNLSNGESTSFIVLGGKVCADPRLNKALTENARLKPFLPQIFNRTELRWLTTTDKRKTSKEWGKTEIQIAAHNEAAPPGMQILASLQAGPRLLPELSAEAEAFVRTEADGRQVDSIGVARTAARTAVGLTADGHMLVVAVAGKGQDEFSSGLSLADMARLLKNLGAVEAINFDGGTSTTMVRFNKATKDYETLIGRKEQTRVRSALVLNEGH